MGVDTQREDMAAREDKALRELTDRLVDDYSDTHTAERVREAIDAALGRFQGRSIRDFVPILVERSARHELDGRPGESTPEVSGTEGGQAATEPDTTAPTAPDSGAAAAGVIEPGATAPGPVESTATAPGTVESSATTPGTVEAAAEPVTTEAIGAALGTAEPSATEPGVIGSSATDPEGPEPESTAPSATNSGATEPGTTAPGTAEPDTTNPGVIEPKTTEPEMTNPDPTESSTTAPDTTKPAATGPGASSPGAGDHPPANPANKFLSSAWHLVGPPMTGGKILVAALVAIVIILVFSIPHNTGKSHQTASAAAGPVTTVRGVVGSEKIPFFTDPKVIDALARKGLRVQVDPAGSRQIATSIDLGKYDFAFPSSVPAAETIMRQHNLTTKYTPFSSPMAIATFTPIVDLLTTAGVVRPGPVPIFDMNRYMDLVSTGKQWNQLPGNTTYPVAKNILVSTTDPRTSNSADMYLAIASYVANDDTIVRGATAEDNAVQKVSKLFVGQGYSDNSSQGPFDQYLSSGIGPTPMVLIYEAQYVDAAVRGKIAPGMELMYPSPTVLSRHTLIPLNPAGDKLGRLLTTDPDLQRLAAEHGFRTGDPEQFAAVTAQHNVPVPPEVVDVVDTPAYDTLEHLLDGVAKAYN